MASKKNQPNNLFQRLTKIFRSGPIVKKKVRGQDTLIARDDLTSTGMMLFSRASTPSSSVINSTAYSMTERLIRYQDFEEMEYCLHGETLIAVPGGYKRIDELAAECEKDPEHTFIVYSYDHNQKKIIPAIGKQARQTRTDKAWVVTFDNGKKIIGTSNHRLLRSDGLYEEIGTLELGTKIVPFIRNGESYVSDVISGQQSFDHTPTSKLSQRTDITWAQLMLASNRTNFDFDRMMLALDVDANSILKILNNNGFQTFRSFVAAYDLMLRDELTQMSCDCPRHALKVVSVEPYSDVEIPLYDLTVDGYKNFATDSVISHNTPEIASAIDIYADETCAVNDQGNSLHIFSENPKIKEVLDDLFYNILNVDFNLRPWIRSLVKRGDFFLFNDVSPEYGVINAFPIPANEIEREEGFDRDDPFAVRFRWSSLGSRVFENWEISHFRLIQNDMFLPYGSSIIEPARKIWRQLILMEDSMMVYRVVRAPERRVFKIDIGNIPVKDVQPYMEEQRRQLKSTPVVDRTTGRTDLRYAPLSVEDDYFIAVRGADSGTSIETLAGGNNAAAIEDVAYLQKKLIASLKVPRAYLGYDEALSSKSTLSQQDIRFSRTINSIQKVIVSELNKLAIIHLVAHGFDDSELQNFTLRLSNPSTIAQQQKLELWRTKFEIAGTAPENAASTEFVQREVWGLTTDQINEINKQRIAEKRLNVMLEAITPESLGGGDEGGAGDDLLGGGGDLGGGLEDISGAGGEEAGGGDELTAAGAGETPPEQNASDDAADDELEEPGVELLMSGDDPDDDDDIAQRLRELDNDKPVNVKNQLARSLYNRSRRRTHGASKTHMPDFNKMVSTFDGSDDPFDTDFFRDAVKGGSVLGESQKTELSAETKRMLDRMCEKLGIDRNSTNNLLFESVQPYDDGSVDVQDEINASINEATLRLPTSVRDIDFSALISSTEEEDE